MENYVTYMENMIRWNEYDGKSNDYIISKIDKTLSKRMVIVLW